MNISQEIRNILNCGRSVAAEIATTQSDMCAFVVIIPSVPDRHNHPEAWREWADKSFGPAYVLKDSSYITGYEIRYLRHDAKYTDTEWGWDYDLVLNDQTTRIKRVFVEKEDEIEKAIKSWLEDLSWLRPAEEFDSSLVDSPLDYYLDRPDERPHLWLD